MKRMRGGFTIVELLIVIVIIAILASITIVAYNGIQQRARDTRRVSDVRSIAKALEFYRIQNGQYPSPTSVDGSWETSNEDGGSGSFMEQLTNAGTINGPAPVDPVNDGNRMYRYYRYAAGTNGCDTARGAFYVIQILDMESSSRPAASNTGYTCPTRDWSVEADWTMGGFEN